jgi:hypothetical protein
MIEHIFSPVAWAHQGGCCMSLPFSSDQDHTVLALVWAHLSSDLQTRVIGLLAQLALNVVVARSQVELRRGEKSHVESATDAQNPT